MDIDELWDERTRISKPADLIALNKRIIAKLREENIKHRVRNAYEQLKNNDSDNCVVSKALKVTQQFREHAALYEFLDGKQVWSKISRPKAGGEVVIQLQENFDEGQPQAVLHFLQTLTRRVLNTQIVNGHPILRSGTNVLFHAHSINNVGNRHCGMYLLEFEEEREEIEFKLYWNYVALVVGDSADEDTE